ncbi:MAG TPA: HD domain-containing phosphohydrolase [Actinomycetota bacterium]|nr:HD domain-containing phosphohydrolase [Actinomycetota bacterium]
MTELDAVRGQLMAFARDVRELYRQERERARDLERALRELSESYLSTMETLAFLVEAKDVGTRQHLDRTQAYALALARAIDPDLAQRPEIAHGFLLHDIGKVGISERVLMKPGPLSPAEWAEMRTHPVLGAQIVSPIRMLGDAVDIIRFHHERYDGSGYPHGLKGDQIPLAARIFSVVDAFDAITSERPYRAARSAEEALDEIVRCSGTHFDPEVVEAFVVLAEDRVLRLTGEFSERLAPASEGASP